MLSGVRPYVCDLPCPLIPLLQSIGLIRYSIVDYYYDAEAMTFSESILQDHSQKPNHAQYGRKNKDHRNME